MVVSQQEKRTAVDKIVEPDSSGQLQLIQLLQRHLLLSPDIESVVRKIKELFPRYFGVDSVTILLYDPTHDVLLDKGYAGIFHANEKSLSNPQSTTLNIFKKSFRECLPLAVEDCLSSDLLPKQYCMDRGLQSLLAVPIVMKDRTFGVLSLEYTSYQHQFVRPEISFYMVVAELIALVLENIRQLNEQKHSREFLHESEDSYFRLFEAVPIGLFRGTPDGRLLRINPALVQILGYPDRDALLATNAFDLYPKKEELERWKGEVLKGAREYDLELQLQRLDGTIIWVRLSCNALRAADGTILHYDGAIADVSEEKIADSRIKEAYQEKELLLKEIHHRVKNNLQIISSLLNLQSDYLRDPYDAELFKQSQARVKAMALLHEKLYQSPDLARIDFGAYLHSLVAHLFQSYQTSAVSIGYSIDADNVHFDIDTAIPCGLIVGELVSNCLKHAFHGRTEGHVWISVGHFDARTIRMSVADNGIGMKEANENVKSAALGLELVKTLSDQISAVLDIQRQEGTRVTLLFKGRIRREGT
jgi:PAS domain S-box-containing protein